MTMDEVLAVGEGDALARLDRFRVVQRASQSVVVLEATAADLSAIADHAVLAMARRADGTVEIVGDKGALEGLDQGARLFVDAWRQRPLHKQDRPGEGLPWDADGFQPP